jgi:hypothetical protein
MIRSILATAAVCLFSLQVQAEPIRVAGWEIRTFPDSGERAGCMMSANYRDGTRMSIVMLRSYTWALGLANRSWGLVKGQKIRTSAYVDNRLIASGSAEVLDDNLALLSLEGAAAYGALRAGQSLELVTPRGRPNFLLTGTDKAMGAVLECVRILNASAQTAEASTAPKNDYQAVPTTEATVLVTNMLNAASIRGYQLIPPKSDNGTVHFNLSDGSMGFFFAFRGKGTPSADDAATSVINSEATGCKGDFASGKQAVPSTDGSVIRKVVTTCRSDATPIVTETTIVRRDSGFLITLGRSGTGNGIGLNDADGSSRADGLVDAAMRIEEPK